jgi:hypothetical protein
MGKIILTGGVRPHVGLALHRAALHVSAVLADAVFLLPRQVAKATALDVEEKIVLIHLA